MNNLASCINTLTNTLQNQIKIFNIRGKLFEQIRQQNKNRYNFVVFHCSNLIQKGIF